MSWALLFLAVVLAIFGLAFVAVYFYFKDEDFNC